MAPPLRRIPLLPLAGLGIVLLAGILAILLSRSVAGANAWANEAVRLQVGSTELAERLAQQESAFRGYLVRGDPLLLGDYRDASAHVRAKLAELDGLTADDTPEQARIDVIAGLVADRIAFMGHYVRERDRLGRVPDTSQVMLPKGRPLAMRIRALLEANALEERRLLARRENWTQRLIDALSIALAATVLLVVLVALVTVGDARRRYLLMTDAHREARTAVLAARGEIQAREEAETQLRQVQRIESLGQLTGGIAHDFNNMLAVIIGSLDMARRRHGEPQRVQRHIENALTGAERAAALVARLLAFSRRQPLAPATIDPAAMIAAMVDLLARTLGEEIRLATEIGAGIWPIHADPAQLENAILNLALNARDAMEGGGELLISAENRLLDEAFVQAHPDVVPGDYVCVAICDRGPGMSAEVQARAFDPFFTTKAVGKGTGLGLSQVFGFAKQSGGHVAIAAREGGGLVVRLYLPRGAPAAAAAAPGSVRHAPASGRGERILVVEDDERVRAFSVEALRELGYAPVAAENGQAALDLLGRGPEPDLLFTDVVMPGIGGPELVSIVRGDRPAMRVLFTTGYARDAAEGAKPPLDPAIAVLAKPFTVTQLAQRVREALEA